MGIGRRNFHQRFVVCALQAMNNLFQLRLLLLACTVPPIPRTELLLEAICLLQHRIAFQQTREASDVLWLKVFSIFQEEVA